MEHPIRHLNENPALNGQYVESTERKLDEIRYSLLEEMKLKNELIEQQEAEIRQLHQALGDEKLEIENWKERGEQARLLGEGHQQLINKLLGDITRLQQDIEWYKRTYERRSFLGYFKQYLNR